MPAVLGGGQVQAGGVLPITTRSEEAVGIEMHGEQTVFVRGRPPRNDKSFGVEFGDSELTAGWGIIITLRGIGNERPRPETA